MNFDPAAFDPTKMDPKKMMEMSRLMQQLPPEQINRMQSIMHNMMAGFDVSREMEEFEKSLPPGFREQLVSIMGPINPLATMGSPAENFVAASPSSGTASEAPKDVQDARLTILRAVAEQRITPDEAMPLLFPHSNE